MIKPINVDLPYPTLDGILPSRKNAFALSPAYSGSQSEHTAILQYTYHHVQFDTFDEETAEIMSGIALAEMMHFEMLGKTLLKLGVEPIYTVCPPVLSDYYNTSAVVYAKSPQKMLLDDLTGEIKAIEQYKRITSNLTDEYVCSIVSRIVLDEELHVKVLKNQLERYAKRTN